MNNRIQYSDVDISNLLERFNRRDKIAFGEMYKYLYKEFYYYSSSLYKDTAMQPEDVVHDLFIYLWEGDGRKFESVRSLKTYCYLVVKHNFVSYIRRCNMMNKNADTILRTENFYIFQAAEAEIFSLLPSVLNILPEDCVESFRMFVEGYSVKEISEQLNKPLTTIYSQKDKAISILRNKLPKNKLLLFMIFLH